MTIVSQVVQRKLCIGCGYCAAQAGTGMQRDDLGFLVPAQDTDLQLSEVQRLPGKICLPRDQCRHGGQP